MRYIGAILLFLSVWSAQAQVTISDVDTLCPGEIVFLTATTSSSSGNIYWYAEGDTSTSIATGSPLSYTVVEGDSVFIAGDDDNNLDTITVSSLPDMFKALSKKRSSNDLLSFHMKFVLLVIIGVLLWNNNDARRFTADVLNDAAEVVRPDSHQLKITF